MRSEINSIGRIVSVAERALTRRLQKHFRDAGFSITVEQWRVLFYLWIEDGKSQKDLSNSVSRDKTSISRLINGLEKKDLVVRTNNRKDKRNNQIFLTPKGKSLKEKMMTFAQKTVKQAQNGITPEDIILCKKVLSKINSNLGVTEFEPVK